jgi:hypothetical protein
MKAVCHVTPVKKFSGKKPFGGHLRTFGCVTLAHNSKNYKNKLDAKSHACIMMSYSEEFKAYRLFDPIKQHIIIKRNVIFVEKISGLRLWKPSFDLSYSHPFGIDEDTGSTFSPICVPISHQILFQN